MLDKVIVDHLDRLEIIEEELDKEVESIISKIDIDVLINEPDEYIQEIIKECVGILEGKTGEIVALGKKFAEAIKKDGNIQIEDTTDGHRNA